MTDIVLYDDKFELKPYEATFMDAFKSTHSLGTALSEVTNQEATQIQKDLRNGKSDIGLAFKEFVEDAPIHPEANKVVILDNLIWVMNQAKIDEDTNGVIRAIAEINKMIKGNLTATQEKKVTQTHLVALVDMTKKKDEEPITIEV